MERAAARSLAHCRVRGRRGAHHRSHGPIHNRAATRFHAMVFLGQTKQFRADVRDAIGQFRRPSITWASSDGSVFTVDDNGLVTAVGDGTAELRATAEGTTATASVTVEQTAANIRVLSGAGQRALAGHGPRGPDRRARRGRGRHSGRRGSRSASRRPRGTARSVTRVSRSMPVARRPPPGRWAATGSARSPWASRSERLKTW